MCYSCYVPTKCLAHSNLPFQSCLPVLQIKQFVVSRISRKQLSFYKVSQDASSELWELKNWQMFNSAASAIQKQVSCTAHSLNPTIFAQFTFSVEVGNSLIESQSSFSPPCCKSKSQMWQKFLIKVKKFTLCSSSERCLCNKTRESQT